MFDHEPTEIEALEVRKACIAFQKEMLGDMPAKETGTLRALIVAYQTEPYSPYRGTRWYTRHRSLDVHLRNLDRRYGSLKLAGMNATTLSRAYEEIRYPDGKDKPERQRPGMAHAAITTIRMLLSFGVAFEIDKQCARLKEILSELRFENTAPRTEAMTVRQCEDVIGAATLPSIALAQALQFELCLRQKDVIGEWVPLAEPGISTVTWHGRKWLRGLRWEEISSNLILNHAMSKSRTGKMLEFDLKLYPMVMAELAKIPQEKRTGPLIVCELTKRPWVQNHFRDKWRGVARKAGVPDTVKNMDSRAGGTTETIEATGGNMEAARKQAGHSDSRTTVRYSRGDLKSNSEVAVLRANSREKAK